jgi:MATE family multidrug resistance protein
MMQQNRKKYGTWSGRKFDWLLFRRLIHFGLPSGIQFFLDMLGFAIFILLVGRFGKIELVATNISFNINTLAFMPMIGMGIAVSILVGHRLGENNPKLGEYSTWSALHLSMFYMIMISVCYVLFPFVFLKPFGYQADPQSFERIYQYGVVILRFVAAYSVFDALNIIFSSAIKGAGDTRFVMKGVVILSWLILVIPTYLAVSVFHWSLFAAWSFATLYVMALGFLFLGRFLQGKWKTMRVIEEPVITI